MHIKNTLLFSTFAFLGASAVAQPDVPTVEGVGLLGGRISKAARRANIESLASDLQRAGEGEPMKPSLTNSKRSFEPENMYDELLGGSSDFLMPASSPSPTPTPNHVFPWPSPTPSFRVVKKQLSGLTGGLDGLTGGLEGRPGLGEDTGRLDGLTGLTGSGEGKSGGSPPAASSYPLVPLAKSRRDVENTE